jgi:hypothetical protein
LLADEDALSVALKEKAVLFALFLSKAALL